MRKMKKTIVIFLMFVLVATSVSAVTITQKNEDNKAVEYTEYNEHEYQTDLKESCECKYVDGYPVMEMPPKTPEELALIDPDPQPTRSFDSLPSQFSWKNYGGDWTTPAKDQANCGSCWAFSALGAMESAIDIASGSPDTNIDLSEQYILSCLSGAGSCSGGWMSTCIDYIQSTSPGNTGNGINGCTIESCMPYQAVDYIPCDDKCDDWDYYTTPPADDNKLFQIEDYGVTTTNEDIQSDWDLLKTWIMDYGPLSVDILASGFGSWGNSHHDPNDVYENDDYGTTNHGVLLVGWVDDANILNGGYWIIKNSWGTGWGYGGFGNIAYGCNGVATRDCVWVKTTQWPHQEDDGPPDVDMAVFADFDLYPRHPHIGEEIQFTDNSEGDVALREWDFDGDGVVDSNAKRPTWTYNQEGEYEVTLTVRSKWGLDSNRTYTVGAKDVWPPVAVVQPDEYADNELTVQFDGRYSYDVDEGGNIVSYHWDFDDKGATSSLRNPKHTFSEPDKIYDVTLTVTDNDGATDSETVEVKIDQTVPPVTTIHHGLGKDGSDWYDKTERISFTATDWTSVIDTFYRVDGGEWTRYASGSDGYISISKEGMHTVEAYSVDYYGNEETPVSDTFGIDKTDPTVDISLSGNMQNGQYIGTVTVTLTAEDDISGIDKILYKNAGEFRWKEYNGPFELSESCNLLCMAVDNAGNTYEESMQIPIEGPPSVPTISGPSKGKPGEELEYTFKAIDYSPSLKDNIYLYIDWGDGDVEDWIGPFDSGEEVVLSHVFDDENVYLIKAKAKDKLGAESDWGELSVTTPKTRSIDFPLLQRFLSNFPVLQEILGLLSNW